MLKSKLGEEEAVCSRENLVSRGGVLKRNWVRRRQYAQEKTGEEEAICSRENWARRGQYAQEKTG
jgi:hypothetical protein